jgi:hypothetical protein
MDFRELSDHSFIMFVGMVTGRGGGTLGSCSPSPVYLEEMKIATKKKDIAK